jgi:hypothetical protein
MIEADQGYHSPSHSGTGPNGSPLPGVFQEQHQDPEPPYCFSLSGRLDRDPSYCGRMDTTITEFVVIFGTFIGLVSFVVWVGEKNMERQRRKFRKYHEKNKEKDS